MPQRLLLINYEYPPLGGGAGNATLYTARELVRLGYDVDVLTSRFGDQPEIESTDGFTIHRLPVQRARMDCCSIREMISFILQSLRGIRHLGRRNKPDLTIAYFGIPCGPAALYLRRCAGVPYVVSLRGGDVPGFHPDRLRQHHQLTAPFLRYLWRHARAVVANSTGLAELASAFDSTPIVCIPNGVDCDTFSPAERVANSTPQLLFVGRLCHQKGLDILFHALSELRDLAWSVELVGDGPERLALEAMAGELGIHDRVTFHGWLQKDQLPAAYQGADLFVFPSRDEGMPNALLEAMASGLPVVATRVAGNVDLIEDGVSGRLVPSEDVPALGAAIRQLLTHAAPELGVTARETVLRSYSWRTVAERYAALLSRGCGLQ